MKKASSHILPPTKRMLETMGEQIKLARLRRGLSADLVAQRAGISRASLWKVEKGDPSVAMGNYAVFYMLLMGWIRIFYLLPKMMN